MAQVLFILPLQVNRW